MKLGMNGIHFSRICELFGKSRQAWYAIRNRYTTNNLREELITEWVRDIRKQLPRVGTVKLYRILRTQLQDHHIKIGRDGLFKLLAKYDLLIKPSKRYVRTTQSSHHFRKWPDLLGNVRITDPEQVWVSDITFLRTENGFIYLSLITDAFSRKIVGFHLSQQLKALGCIAALRKAINGRINPSGSLIHHSDRGIQYCCEEYVSLLEDYQIQISMTQTGSPYDNAIAERVNGILKTEFYLDKVFKSYHQAIEPVSKAIFNYNNVRPHLSCQLNTPEHQHQTIRTRMITKN